ncbi:MAG: hypothetical protein ACE5FH_12805, partial [Candidatus Zixiibacteriota bacterium]
NLEALVGDDSTPGVSIDDDRADELAAKLFRRAYPNLIVPLKAMESPEQSTVPLLAADNQPDTPAPSVENLATMYCEKPELILQVMRDNRSGQAYLQLASDNPAMFSHVLVELPDLKKSIVTDTTGRAPLTEPDDTDWSSLRWQVKLPGGEFALDSLGETDKDSGDQTETTLKSPQGDKIKVSLSGSGSQRKLSVELLELGGTGDPGPVVLAVSCDDMTETYPAKVRQPVVISLSSLPAMLSVRVYT